MNKTRASSQTNTSRPRRHALEERLAALVLATDFNAIDATEFYTIGDVCRKLKCDERTLKRRCDDGKAPWLVTLLNLRRCPAFLFWAWVVEEIRTQLGEQP